MKARHTFRASVDQRLQALRVLLVHQPDQGRAHPPPRVDRIESADDHVELHVVVVVLVLDLAVVAGSRRAEVNSLSRRPHSKELTA